MTQAKTLIGIRVYKPAAKSERPELRRLYCSLPDPQSCPLLQKEQCICQQWLARQCVYGSETREAGWTRRAKKYRSWLAAAEAKAAEGPKMPRRPDKRMAVVGDYVWLPYTHMAMCEAVPFLAHGGAFRTEQPFLKLEDFTPENIVTLVKFRPYALMGGEITVYRLQQVPLFLYDLKHQQPELYQSAADLDAVVIERTPTPESFKNTAVPISVVKVGTNCKVNGFPFTWDGECIDIQIDAGDISWAWKVGKEKMKYPSLCFAPTHDLEVTVEDEEELLRLFEAGAFAA